MDYKDYLGWVMTAFQGALITIQANPTAQKILFYVTLITAFVNLIYSVQRWYKTAMADKKVTSSEKQNLIQMLINGGKEILEIFTGNYEIVDKKKDIPVIEEKPIIKEINESLKNQNENVIIKQEGEENKNEELNRNQDNDQFID